MKRNNSVDLLNKVKPLLRWAALAILVILTISFARNISKIRGAGDRIEEARVKNEILKVEIEKLGQELELLESDAHVESEIRNKLGLAREGEIIVVLPDDEILRKIAPRIEFEQEQLPDPNWKQWMTLFL